MKTVTNGKEIKRVENAQATTLVDKKGWKYCSKELWKKQVRDVESK
jgi:hypothetical protein